MLARVKLSKRGPTYCLQSSRLSLRGIWKIRKAPMGVSFQALLNGSKRRIRTTWTQPNPVELMTQKIG